MLFLSYQERLAHPEARLIPISLWDIFENELSERHIQCLQGMPIATEHLDLLTEHEALTLWICICIGNKEKNTKEKLHLARQQLNLDEYDIFLVAIATADLALLDHLYQSRPKLIQRFMREREYQSFLLAANDHSASLEWLTRHCEDISSMIESHGNAMFAYAVDHENLEFLNWLFKQASSLQQSKILNTGAVDAIQLTIRKGQYAFIHWFIEKMPEFPRFLILNDYKKLFKWASSKNDIKLLDWIAAQLRPEILQSLIAESEFKIFQIAAANNQVSIIHWFLKNAPSLKEAMLTTHHFAALRYAVAHQHQETLFLLLYFYPCLDFALQQEDTYLRHQTCKFIKDNIELLIALFSDPEVLGDKEDSLFADPDLIHFAFCLLKGIIYSPSLTQTISLEHVLSIPFFKTLACTSPITHQTNELMKLAISQKNLVAVRKLLEIDEIRELTEENHFYLDNDVFKTILKEFISAPLTKDECKESLAYLLTHHSCLFSSGLSATQSLHAPTHTTTKGMP